MVATAPSTPSSLAGPPAQGRSASRIASDRQGATEVLPENAVSELLARRRPDHAVATCTGRTRPHRRDAHRDRGRFSGQTRNGYYCRARYYHPGLQRFISEDPIELAAGDPNFYSYVGNDPINNTDPTGEVLLGGCIAGAAISLGEDVGLYLLTGRKTSVGAAVGNALIGCATGAVGGKAFQLAGKLISRVTRSTTKNAGIQISERGLALVEKHLAQFGADAPNAAMLQRLREALDRGVRVVGADANFYLHEATEAAMMARGLGYEVAHAAALAKYGVSQLSLYHAEVVQRFPGLFSSAYRAFWGLK